MAHIREFFILIENFSTYTEKSAIFLYYIIKAKLYKITCCFFSETHIGTNSHFATYVTNKLTEFTDSKSKRLLGLTRHNFFLLGLDNFRSNLSLQYLPTHNLISSDVSALVLHKPHHDTLKVSKLSSHYDQFCNELSANHLQTFFFLSWPPTSFQFSML